MENVGNRIWRLKIFESNPANNRELFFSTFSSAKKYARQYVDFDWNIYKNDVIHTTHNRRKTTEE